MKTIETESLIDIEKAADEFLSYLKKEKKESRCIIFFAPMGAGKTTFIKALCKSLKVKDEVSSPTFSIVNEYLTENGEKIFHFDLYRIKDIGEALSAGAEEYIYGTDYCFIEWPEILLPLLPKNAVEVKINVSESGKRTLTIS